MNYINYFIVLFFFILFSHAQAKSLEIKVQDNSISVPYWPAKTAHYGGVLMVNGGQAQWSELLAYFAKKLSGNGWSVVLLNCTQDAKATPWVEQLPEVLRALRQKNNKRIVLVHYGDQLTQSLDYFSKPQAKMINGLVMVSAYDTQNEAQASWSLRFPVFDIVGQFDYDEVLRQTVLRKKEFPQKSYLAACMPGSGHDYEYNQGLLLAFMQGWMARLPEFKLEPPPISVSYIEPVYFSESYISAIGEYFRPMVVDGAHQDRYF